MSTAFINKTMPKMSGGTANRDSSFSVGRRAFNNNIDKTHQVNNLGKNLDYSDVKNKLTSNMYAKPLQDMSSSSRIQRLRLSATGSSFNKVNNKDQKVSILMDGGDTNLVNNFLTRVRGSGGYKPKR
tara:strand:- start:1219 stop:1599 length:381 start_codon:yes stop_codon:yes gene_type:complete